MSKYFAVAILFLLTFLPPPTILAQTRGAPQPQRGQRGTTTAKPPVPLTLRQVIESLVTLRSSRRMEDQIAKTGVQFQATPEVVDILKQFGASAKLIAMIPVPPPPPPPPPAPPAPKVAGPLTIICEPRDCVVVVEDKYEGPTEQNRKTVSGLRAGAATVQVFAEGYDHITRQVQLEEDKPAEEKFALRLGTLVRQERASASLLRVVASLGGADGFAAFGDLEGSGTLHWTNSSGTVEEWAMTFNKRMGRDLAATFKSRDGQCTASILAQTTKQECRSGLKNRGERIAEQATSLLLSYQLQDVVHALLNRPLITSESDDNRVESFDAKDSYILTIGTAGLPTDLVYRIGDAEAPIHVQYADYTNLNRGRYPGRISIGRLNNAPVWVFTISSVRSKAVRGQ